MTTTTIKRLSLLDLIVFSVIAPAICLALNGCGSRSREVILEASTGGQLFAGSGDISYTDGKGQAITLKDEPLPWRVKLSAQSGQTLKVSINGVGMGPTYRVIIEIGDDPYEMEEVCAQTGTGGQDVSCSYTLP